VSYVLRENIKSTQTGCHVQIAWKISILQQWAQLPTCAKLALRIHNQLLEAQAVSAMSGVQDPLEARARCVLRENTRPTLGVLRVPIAKQESTVLEVFQMYAKPVP